MATTYQNPAHQIIDKLAVGGMAEIFIARDENNRRVALKRLKPRFRTSPGMCELFKREAHLGAYLRHPNLVAVHDTTFVASNHYFTMELVSGMNLRRVVVGAIRRGARLTIGHALTAIMGAAAGLHHAHEAVAANGRPLNVVHRDISPANVLIGFDGSVRVADFGVAQIGSCRRQTDAQGRRIVTGKASYMSPEQCLGQPLDRRSDVFALGILLFETTTGKRLFVADNDRAIHHKIGSGEVTRPSQYVPDFPRQLEAIIMRALSLRPDDRYASADELRMALAEFARQRGLDCSQAGFAAWMMNVFGAEAAAAEAEAEAEAESAARVAKGTASNMSEQAQDAVSTNVLDQAKRWLNAGDYAEAMSAFAWLMCARSDNRQARAGYELARGSRALDAGDRATAGHCFRSAWQVDLSNVAMAKFVLAFERDEAARRARVTSSTCAGAATRTS